MPCAECATPNGRTSIANSQPRYLRGKDSKCARANPRMRPADPAGARRDAPAMTGLSAACFGLRRHRFVVVGAHTATPAVTPLGVQPRSSVVGAPILAGRRSPRHVHGGVRPPVDITQLPHPPPSPSPARGGPTHPREPERARPPPARETPAPGL